MSAVEPFELSSTIGTWRRSWSWRITSNPSRSGSARSSSTMSGRSSSSTASAASPRWAATTRNPSPDRASATWRVTLASSATRTSGGVVISAPFDVQCAPRGQIATRPPSTRDEPECARSGPARLAASQSKPPAAAHPGRNGATLYADSRRASPSVHGALMYFDEFKHQLPDIDEAETQDWLDSLDQVVDQEGENRARFLMFKLLKRARQRHVGLPSLTQHPVHQHDQPRAGAVLPGRRGARAPHPAAGPLERRRDGPARPTTGTRGSAATSRRTPPRPACTRSGFNHFFQGKDDPGGGDQVFFQGHAAPGHLRPRLPRGPPVRGPARPLPARDRRQRA